MGRKRKSNASDTGGRRRIGGNKTEQVVQVGWEKKRGRGERRGEGGQKEDEKTITEKERDRWRSHSVLTDRTSVSVEPPTPTN